MLKPLLMLIPPMGHDSRFYGPLRDALAQSGGSALELLTPDYPDLLTLSPLHPDEILEFLAQHFRHILQMHLASLPPQTHCAIGGVSLGGTLSIRLNHLLAGTPMRVLLLASGGLKVSRARCESITRAIADFGPADFLLKAMAIDGDCYAASSFPRQFQQSSAAIADYWACQAHTIVRQAADPNRAANFVKLTQAALGVNYEAHMAAESANYSILWSARDKVFSPRMYRRFQQLATQARFQLLNDIGHYAPLENPPRIAALIRQDLFNEVMPS